MRRRSFGKIVRHVLVFCMVTMLMLAGCRQSKDGEDAGQDPSQREQTSGSGQNLSGSEKDPASGRAGGLPGSDGGSDLAGSALEESDENKEKGSDQGSMKDIYRVGDSLEDGDLEITYMASGDYVEESEYQQPAAGYKYIYLQFAFRNIGMKRDCPISLFAFSCFADSFAAQAYYGGQEDLPPSLPAGRYAIGNLCFCVPEDAQQIEVEYQPDQLTKDRVRFAFEGEKNAGIVPAPDVKPSENAFKVGDTASSALQQISYLSCEKDDRDNENVHPEEGCTYYTLTFEFENLQAGDRQISVHDFSCYADGKSCSRTLFRDDYLSADVPGGRKAKGTVTFEVPDDAQTVEVEYDTGNRSDAHVIFTVR